MPRLGFGPLARFRRGQPHSLTANSPLASRLFPAPVPGASKDMSWTCAARSGAASVARLVYGTTAPPCNFSHSAAINVTELVLLLTQEVEELLDCCPRGPVAIALQLKPARFFWQLPLAKVVWKGLNKDSWHPAHERTADNPPPPPAQSRGNMQCV